MDSSSFQDNFTCSICKDYFMDPVTIGCGHSFCRPCLCTCWKEAQHPPSCPLCKEKAQQKNLKTNLVLETRVFLARRARASHLPRSQEQICEIHLKKKDYFCEVAKEPVCLSCSRLKEHRAHTHSATDWTAELYRRKLLRQMRSLWEKIEENQRNLNRQSSITPKWVDYVNTQKKVVSIEYWLACHFIYNKQQHLEQLEKESREVYQKLKEKQDRMVLKGQLLREMYEQLKEMCQRPDMKLNQNFKDILQRSETVQMCLPQLMIPKLSCWPVAGLKTMIRVFHVHVSWDNEIDTCHISLLEDIRCSLFGQYHLDATHCPTRSECSLAWGHQPFTSGQYYWEVDVGDCCNWAVGLCEDSWTMRNEMLSDSEGIFLLCCVKEDNECHLFTYPSLSPQYMERPVGHVGVFLDYDLDKVSFVHVETSSFICSLLSCSFSSPIRPFFCLDPN